MRLGSGAIRPLLASATLASLPLAGWVTAARASQRVSPSAMPKLAVLIVVDQMRADYVERFRSDWTGGFKRLLNEGAWFSRAEYPYLFTVTCAGHATISTGTFPHSHGIVGNTWFDRARKQTL